MKKVSMEELYDVLCLYADKNNYVRWGQKNSLVELDKGLKARKLLKRLIKENLNAASIKNNL